MFQPAANVTVYVKGQKRTKAAPIHFHSASHFQFGMGYLESSITEENGKLNFKGTPEGFVLALRSGDGKPALEKISGPVLLTLADDAEAADQEQQDETRQSAEQIMDGKDSKTRIIILFIQRFSLFESVFCISAIDDRVHQCFQRAEQHRMERESQLEQMSQQEAELPNSQQEPAVKQEQTENEEEQKRGSGGRQESQTFEFEPESEQTAPPKNETKRTKTKQVKTKAATKKKETKETEKEREKPIEQKKTAKQNEAKTNKQQIKRATAAAHKSKQTETENEAEEATEEWQEKAREEEDEEKEESEQEKTNKKRKRRESTTRETKRAAPAKTRASGRQQSKQTGKVTRQEISEVERMLGLDENAFYFDLDEPIDSATTADEGEDMLFDQEQNLSVAALLQHQEAAIEARQHSRLGMLEEGFAQLARTIESALKLKDAAGPQPINPDKFTQATQQRLREIEKASELANRRNSQAIKKEEDTLQACIAAIGNLEHGIAESQRAFLDKQFKRFPKLG
jgi:hypothetical protein